MSKNKYRISEKTYADDRVIFVPEHKYDIKDVFKGQVWQCIGINDCKSMEEAKLEIENHKKRLIKQTIVDTKIHDVE